MKKKKQKKQYKVWVHIETWIDGEPIEGDEDPHSVEIPMSDDNLIDSKEMAEEIADKAASVVYDYLDK